jgi:oligoribonuclease
MNQEYNNFIWVSMETTGDDPLVDKITSISMRITDGNINIIDDNSITINITDNLDSVEKELIDFAKPLLKDQKKAPLAGYNISAKERAFINKLLINFEEQCLHYRNLDLSSMDIITKNIYPDMKLPKQSKVTNGLDIINNSINQTVFLKNTIFKDNKSPNSKTEAKENEFPEFPYLIWTDLETTGFDPVKNDIIEIATIITDGNLNIIGNSNYQEVIKIDDSVIKNGNPFAIKLHEKSGLLEKCVNADNDKTLLNAENGVMKFINSIIPEGQKAPLAGNSIGSLDTPFIKVNMNNFYKKHLSDVSLDVTSLTMMVNNFIPTLEMPTKKRGHLALDDIMESIKELKFLKEKALKPPLEIIKKKKIKPGL